MGLVPETAHLLSRLPTHLATDLFASANPVKLAADQVLFLADDPGDSYAFAEKHPELYKSLITLLTQRLRETNVAVAAGSFLSLRGRVALTLLELAGHFGRNVGSDRIVVQHKIGQSDLAAMTGIARENLSCILKDWERRKIVSRLSGYYCLENKSKLEREVQQL